MVGRFSRPDNFVSQDISQLADLPQLNTTLHPPFMAIPSHPLQRCAGVELVSRPTDPACLPSVSDELSLASKADCCGQNSAEMRGPPRASVLWGRAYWQEHRGPSTLLPPTARTPCPVSELSLSRSN